MQTAAPASTLAAEYRDRFPGSARLYERAVRLMPSGVNHDVRRIVPFPVYVDHADGCRKWDVDGNELIDYTMGHGSLMLGHRHPVVQRAIEEQLGRVSHASAPTALEVRWAELVTSIVPSAEMVRFVMSGTEATMLAMRLARAHTRRPVIVKVEGHFHGWHDYAMVGFMPPFDLPSSNGVPEEVTRTVRHVPIDDLAALEAALEPGDVAAVILEPDGPSAGQVPLVASYLRAATELAHRHGALLILDEVITGFRLAPGGAQEFFGVSADLGTYAKAIAGGFPSGAVAGRADVMSDIAFRDDAAWNRRERVRHQGTYSAFPVAAAAGVAALEILADGSPHRRATELADRLRAGLNAAMAELGVRGCAYGNASILRLVLGDDLPDVHEPREFLSAAPRLRLLEGIRQPLHAAWHQAILLEGVDVLASCHGYVSAVHDEAAIDASVERMKRALRRVIAEGHLTAVSRPTA